MNQFSILSWNVHGRGREITTPFKVVLPRLIQNESDIICLQEMTDAETKFSDVSEFAAYNVFIPAYNRRRDSRKIGFNHNVLLSKYPIVSAEELEFPKFSNMPIPMERAVRADIRIGETTLRVYNCHFVLRLAGMATRLAQLEFILADAQNHKGPIIVCGDMNAATPKAGMSRQILKWWARWPREELHFMGRQVQRSEKEIFQQQIEKHGFKEILDLSQPTWSFFRFDIWQQLQLKLDWFLVKNLNTVEATLGEYLTDHRPISVKCKIMA